MFEWRDWGKPLKSTVRIEPELLYDWRFTANQFFLATSPLRVTTSIFIFQLNTCGYGPYITSSLTRGWSEDSRFPCRNLKWGNFRIEVGSFTASSAFNLPHPSAVRHWLLNKEGSEVSTKIEELLEAVRVQTYICEIQYLGRISAGLPAVLMTYVMVSLTLSNRMLVTVLLCDILSI
jgi:hypothetical protein